MNKITANQKAFVNAIKSIILRLEKTEQFVLAQAPEICKQMVKEYTFDTCLDLSMTAFFTLIGVTGGLVTAIQMIDASQSTEAPFWIPRIIICVVSWALFCISFEQLISAIKNFYFVKNCPKLFLLREFKNLVNQ